LLVACKGWSKPSGLQFTLQITSALAAEVPETNCSDAIVEAFIKKL